MVKRLVGLVSHRRVQRSSGDFQVLLSMWNGCPSLVMPRKSTDHGGLGSRLGDLRPTIQSASSGSAREAWAVSFAVLDDEGTLGRFAAGKFALRDDTLLRRLHFTFNACPNAGSDEQAESANSGKDVLKDFHVKKGTQGCIRVMVADNPTANQ